MYCNNGTQLDSENDFILVELTYGKEVITNHYYYKNIGGAMGSWQEKIIQFKLASAQDKIEVKITMGGLKSLEYSEAHYGFDQLEIVMVMDNEDVIYACNFDKDLCNGAIIQTNQSMVLENADYIKSDDYYITDVSSISKWT